MMGARNTDPQTSYDAAASVQHKQRQSQKDVWDVLSMYKDGVSDTELVRYYTFLASRGIVSKQSESGIRTRRKELVVKGRVYDTEKKERLPSGRLAIIWKVVGK